MMLLFSLINIIQSLCCLLHSYNIVNDVLVDFVNLCKFSKVNTLAVSNKFNFGSVGRCVIERHYHTARNIQELTVNLENSCSHFHVLYAMLTRYEHVML